MTGLELAKSFYAACKPILCKAIPDIMKQAAAGLVGEGSECFGCDDNLSHDHDFGAAFCLWLPCDLLRANQERIETAFATLPMEFQGFTSRLVPAARHGRVGPLPLENFYYFFTGLKQPPDGPRQWLSIPEYQLAAATNGLVFEDPLGKFSSWREILLNYYPRDVWLKKLASHTMLAAQAGQYNLPRALTRADGPAAMLAAARFAENAINLVFLLNRRYMPFYKWASKLGRKLPRLGLRLGQMLDDLAAQPLRGRGDMEAATIVEEFCALLAAELRSSGVSNVEDSWLWAHGPNIIRNVKDVDIKRMNLLSI